MKDYLQALRPLDSLMIALVFIISVLLCARTASYSFFLSVSFLSAFLSVLLLYGGGNIINDHFDQRADQINRKEKRHRHRALLWSGLTLGAALLLSLFGGPGFFSVTLLIGALLLIYGRYSKALGIVKNLFAAVTGSMVFTLGPLLTGTAGLNWFCLPLSLLFITAREVVKDIEDMEGDRAGGARTIPIRFGVTTAFVVAVICSASGLALSFLYYRMNAFSPLFLTFLSFATLLFIIGNIFVFIKEAHTFRRYIETVMLFLLLGTLT